MNVIRGPACATLVSIVLLVAGLSCASAGTEGRGAAGMRVVRNEKAIGAWSRPERGALSAVATVSGP